MNRYILSWLSIIFIACAVTELYARPKIKLEKNSYDLGQIDENEILDFCIPIFNEGTEPLEIDFVKTSCGCVEIREYDKVIPEGQKGEIAIKVDISTSGNGQKSQMVFFKTNDVENPQISVKLYYRKALPEVAISPKSVKILLSKDEIQNSTGSTRNMIVVVDTWKECLKVTDIRTSSNINTHFYDILYRCPTGAETHILRFNTFLSNKLASGPFDEWISFSTNHPLYPTIRIPITGEIQSNITIQPKIIIVRKFSEDRSSISKTVTIGTTGNGQPLEIREITCNRPWIKVEPIEINNERIDLVISIKLPEDYSIYENKKVIKSNVLIKFKEPDEIQKTIEIVSFL